MRYADVILPLATPPMTFAVDEAMRPGLRTGMRVMVQLGARKFYAGIVSRLHDEPPAYKTIKPIVRIVDEREAATPEQLRLWEWISSYYMCPPGMVMRAALPAKLKLDGYSEDETLRSGYRAPLRTSACIRLSAARSSCMSRSIRCRVRVPSIVR